jgi:homoserine dehydrogenase
VVIKIGILGCGTVGSGLLELLKNYPEIQVQKDTSIVLEISHNDGIWVSVNGKEVFQATGPKDFKAIARERTIELMSSFKVDLKKGSNSIVIKSETKGAARVIKYESCDLRLAEFYRLIKLHLNKLNFSA